MAKRKPAQPEPKTEKLSGGKGKKICPECSAELGARTLKCECGHEFQPKTKTTKRGGLSLRDQLEERLAEIDQILSSRDALEIERSKIEELLEAISS